ncbi:hypothetical protein [Pseudoduganella albidiflava]|uniref:Lipoprotein n=1 Tax=Pseudoduganella albidiflava TaxID=321983 RepID=A0ABX5RP22_9BURK|nr:hypothetical protein [Pseudoduganella albidiflava]QBH99524.1 hypothetical protein EYF70_00720 [Pseudoduganella albidiflava]
MLLALAATTLPGCSRDDAPPRVAAVPKPAQPQAVAAVASNDPHAALMRAIFGDDYLPAEGHAIEGGPVANVQDGELPLVLTATTSMLLPSGETALVVEGSFQRPAGDELLGDVEGAPIHLYLLRQQDGAWHVVRKHENIAEKGRHGTDVRWLALGPGKPGLAVETHWLGQGYQGTWLALYDPASDKVENLLGDSLMTMSNNEGVCEAECWSGEAKWRMDTGSGASRNAPYDDLVLDITGEETLQPANDVEGDSDEASPAQTGTAAPARKRSLASTARYAFSGGSYQLQEGANTLPSF